MQSNHHPTDWSITGFCRPGHRRPSWRTPILGTDPAQQAAVGSSLTLTGAQQSEDALPRDMQPLVAPGLNTRNFFHPLQLT